ncbi:MAG: protein-disulfide reductase DsbD N-terminal domain-containing protein [Candidatus Didemnitutus sp.]|nr:protein-disulfide reductase DsbD N-terminal domain-containing protein [Candidatus Didemnitutus sp.]
MKRAVSFALFSLLVITLHAQVRCSLEVEATTIPLSTGGKLLATLTVNIDPGWHIASITQPDGGPVRTEIALAEKQPFKLAGPITGPKPRVEHSEVFDINVETHEGRVTFTIPLEATVEIAPGTILAFEVTFQACTDENCLLPTTDRVTAVIGTTGNGADIERAANEVIVREPVIRKAFGLEP